jgi:predicted nucleic acid-binding protein
VGLVVDTSALIALERAGADWERNLGSLGDEQAVVPAVVYAELLVGVHLADSPERATGRRARVERFVSKLPIVEFTREIAERWAELFAALSRSGTMIPSNDLAVAATAQQLEFAVLIGPRDERHYRRVPGLRCEVLHLARGSPSRRS